MRKLLGLDLDGCLFDFVRGMRRVQRECRGYDIPLTSEQDEWGDHETIGVSKADWDWMWGRGIRELFSRVPTYPDALDGVKTLQGVVDLCVITHRPVRVADISLYSLGNIGIRPRSVVHCGGTDKSLQPACDAYVEDRVENVMDIALAHDVPVFMPRRGWNRVFHDAKNFNAANETDIRPFDNWKDVIAWART